mmetsp:Transcript_46788/g.109200  ORF Transcript_46788/g.109200 Transcript_46788/m.109200 type:complete len:292 (-) Transcript_46788:530-1405(-)
MRPVSPNDAAEEAAPRRDQSRWCGCGCAGGAAPCACESIELRRPRPLTSWLRRSAAPSQRTDGCSTEDPAGPRLRLMRSASRSRESETTERESELDSTPRIVPASGDAPSAPSTKCECESSSEAFGSPCWLPGIERMPPVGALLGNMCCTLMRATGRSVPYVAELRMPPSAPRPGESAAKGEPRREDALLLTDPCGLELCGEYALCVCGSRKGLPPTAITGGEVPKSGGLDARLTGRKSAKLPLPAWPLPTSCTGTPSGGVRASERACRWLACADEWCAETKGEPADCAAM